MDPYALCSCGSGKKFKWCCQPIQAELGQVFSLLEQGQAEAAIRGINDDQILPMVRRFREGSFI